MRGRYTTDNIENLIFLIEQMTPDEISDISTQSFDLLWNNLWDINNIKNKNHHKEYIQSKQKFYQLKMNHPNLIKNISPLYDFNEWGFPKGRREPYESDLVCAIREFEEETNLKEPSYTVLEKCKSIRENLTGTNGIHYAHNYFLSIINDNTNSYDETNREIGQTSVLNITECLERIRPYHKNKIRIIKNIYISINNFLKEYSKID
jgi:ADP-ribose pyrophosphatase YjhB (NUDIX family)